MGHAAYLNVDMIRLRQMLTDGGYVRLFTQPGGWSPPGVAENRLAGYFLDFANRRMVEAPGVLPEDILANANLFDRLERDFSSTIPAGYTYFGQFLNHDITHDKNPLRLQPAHVGNLTNLRTPWLDLDSVYGRGPGDRPDETLFDRQGMFLIGRASDSSLRDLPREDHRALIGDDRNDENTIISQLHLAFLLAHNALVERARARGDGDPFKSARRTLQWLYQHIVWHDFLKRVTDPDVHGLALRLVTEGGKRWENGLREVFAGQDEREPPIPVEFSAAAFRFGHSMVRNAYRTNGSRRGPLEFVPLFASDAQDSPGGDLRGRRRLATKNGIQWSWFLPMGAGEGFPLRARKIDTKLANALAFLREDNAANAPTNVLAYRNLVRGWGYQLVSGSDIAASAFMQKLGVQPIRLDPKEDIDALWYYILREAQEGGGNALGRLGSVIVCGTIAFLLKADPNAYFNADPQWSPDAEPSLLAPTPNGELNRDGEVVDARTGARAWTLASIIRLAGVPADLDEFQAQATPV